MHALLALALLAAQPDSADAGLRIVLGAEAALRGEAVPGILLASTPDGRTRAATLRVTSASPALLWWRASAGAACPDTARGEPELAAGHLVGGDDAFYFCARPRTDAPLRLVARMRAGTGSSTAVAELPAPARGGISPLWIAVLTALLGLGSGILVNYFTSRNQLRADLARRQQEFDAVEREKRMEIVGALNRSLIADVQHAVQRLRELADSKTRRPEDEWVLPRGGMEVVGKTRTLREFLETGDGKEDFGRLQRVYALMGQHNRAIQPDQPLGARRDLARRTLAAIEQELSSGGE
ncbi:MAG TPA: hypothetical protein VNP72_04380 [Longimicrobium sp.]|nr:hypothetical protein [Longimicrobium sp.]